MKEIYTIGYSGFTIENFLKTLKYYKISCLVDVRSMPKSAYFTDFNKSNLSNTLSKHKIIYRNYAEEFGARQLEKQYYTDDILDFEKFTKSPQFIKGFQKIETGMRLNYSFALMCAEKRPEDCHRNIMIARQFYLHGYEVRNILEDGTYINQDMIEKILLDKYFPHREQLSLFDELSTEEMINQSYKKRNREIGYRLESVGEYDEQNLHNRIY